MNASGPDTNETHDNPRPDLIEEAVEREDTPEP